METKSAPTSENSQKSLTKLTKASLIDIILRKDDVEVALRKEIKEFAKNKTEKYLILEKDYNILKKHYFKLKKDYFKSKKNYSKLKEDYSKLKEDFESSCDDYIEQIAINKQKSDERVKPYKVLIGFLLMIIVIMLLFV